MRPLASSGAEAAAGGPAAFRGDLEASNLYITSTELRKQLASVFDKLGQQDSGAAHYRSVVRAWAQADPQFTPRVRATQQRLGALQPIRKTSEN